MNDDTVLELDIEDNTLLALTKLAHEQNVTLNELLVRAVFSCVLKLLQTEMEELKSDLTTAKALTRSQRVDIAAALYILQEQQKDSNWGLLSELYAAVLPEVLDFELSIEAEEDRDAAVVKIKKLLKKRYRS